MRLTYKNEAKPFRLLIFLQKVKFGAAGSAGISEASVWSEYVHMQVKKSDYELSQTFKMHVNSTVRLRPD